jgi:hypothetical protein
MGDTSNIAWLLTAYFCVTLPVVVFIVMTREVLTRVEGWVLRLERVSREVLMARGVEVAPVGIATDKIPATQATEWMKPKANETITDASGVKWEIRYEDGGEKLVGADGKTYEVLG